MVLEQINHIYLDVHTCSAADHRIGCFGCMQVSTVAQLAILVPRQPAAAEEGPLCVVNTHLFFHPKASHIRTLHVAAMLAEAHALMDVAGRQLGRTPSLLFCGDLNSDKNDGISGEECKQCQQVVLSDVNRKFLVMVDFSIIKESP